MKNSFAATFLSLVYAVFGLVVTFTGQNAVARGHNPAVSNQFFQNVQTWAGNCSDPGAQAPMVTGMVNSVSWQQLACQLQSMAGGQQKPLVVTITTSSTRMCSLYKNDPQATSDICQAQVTEDDAVARALPGVLFVSVDAVSYPQVMLGVDVRVLPSHMLIKSYSDTAHYEALVIMGYLDMVGLTGAVNSVFSTTP